MINLDEEYRIDPTWEYQLWHGCTIGEGSNRDWDWPVIDGKCRYCQKQTPKKIQVMYKLWRLNNI